MPSQPMPLAAICTTASALPGTGGYPIEVAVADVGTGRVWSRLVLPTLHWTEHGFWDDGDEEGYGIGWMQLQVEGRPVAEVADALLRRCRGCLLVSDAPGIDRAWISMLLRAAGCSGDHLLILDALSYLAGVTGRDRDELLLQAGRLARLVPGSARAPDGAQRYAHALRVLSSV